MRIDELENALSGVNEKTLDSILMERHRRMEKKKTKSFVNTAGRKSHRFPRRNIAMAAVAMLLICSLSVIIPLSIKNSWNGVDPIGTEGPKNTKIENPPQYIPAHDTPNLEEVYALTPYSELLPQKLLPNCAFQSSYMSKYDPIANPSNSKYLRLVFSTGKELWESMEIRINEYDGSEIFANIHNKKTYALSYLYGNNSELNAEDRDVFSGLFHAEDITFNIVNERVYTMSDGLCKAEISVLCGEYVVSYAYTGSKIAVENFYHMIISSNWLS